MSITAKELAKQLGLSPSAVSIALNNKPGISTETRQKIRLSHRFRKVLPPPAHSMNTNCWYGISMKKGTF